MAVEPQSRGRGGQEGILDAIQPVEGAIFGAISFILGYILTLIVVLLAETDEFTQNLIESAGFIYYNAQFTDLEISLTERPEGFGLLIDDKKINYVMDDEIFVKPVSLEAPSILYHLIPVVILLLAGFAIARYVGARDTQNGALGGASIVIGTVPLSLIGTFIFRLKKDGAVLAPVLTDSILFVGILFPLILGAIGGAISTKV